MKKQPVDFGNRFFAAIVMFIAAFSTGLIIWYLILFYLFKITSFSFVIYFTIVFTLYAFICPKTALNKMESLWKGLMAIIKSLW